MKRLRPTLLVPVLLLAVSLVGHPSAQQRAADKGEDLYPRVVSILTKHCASCHGNESPQSDINVLDLASLLHDTKTDRPKGPAVIASKPDESRVIVRIGDAAKPMPPKSEKNPVSPTDLKVLKDWIAKGAGRGVVVKAEPPPPAVLAADVKQLFRAHCARCHDGPKLSGGMAIFDHEKLLKNRLVVPSKPAESALLTRLKTPDEHDVMPPGGRLDEPLIAKIQAWIDAGAPPFEAVVEAKAGQLGHEYVLKAIHEDVAKLRRDPDQAKLVKYTRYFSLNHLVAGGITPSDLEANRKALALAVNHLTWKRDLVKVKPIDELKTVFRVDISQLGWDETPFVQVADLPEDTKDNGWARRVILNFWDLVLLEYPYGFINEANEAFRKVYVDCREVCGTIVPLPYVRGDWFVNVALKTPLYEDMLQLPHELGKFEEHRLKLDSRQAVRDEKVMRAGMSVSGVSRNNRVVERYDPEGSPFYYKSYDFKTNRSFENMFRDPVGLPLFSGGEMIWGLPNGMQGYLVTDNKGNRIDAAPTEIVTDKFASDQVVRNGLACIRCHATGINDFRDGVRPVLDKMNVGARAFDLAHAQAIYPREATFKAAIAKDRKLFLDALGKLFGEENSKTKTDGSVLVGVAERYSEARLTGRTAAAELGVKDLDKTQARFDNNDLLALGLAQLAHNGDVARDAWEESFGRVVDGLNVGRPVLPLDGLGTPNHGEDGLIAIDFKTNRKTFHPGDDLVITVKNNEKVDVFCEVLILGTKGQGLVVHPVAAVKPGATCPIKPITIAPGAGVERVVLYASKETFPSGTLLALTKRYGDGYGMADRFVHVFYALTDKDGRLVPKVKVPTIVKRTLEFVTE